MRKKMKNNIKKTKGNNIDLIYLSNNDVMKVDPEDYEKLIKYTWWSDIYAKARINGKNCLAHRFILGNPKDYCVDHINGDKLDNRKCNLRLCTHTENNRHQTRLCRSNTSGKTGVSWIKSNKTWRAIITVNYKEIRLGQFKNKEDAIAARIEAEKKYYGEFAPLI